MNININEINDPDIVEVMLVLLGRQTMEHVRRCHNLNVPIESAVIWLIVCLELWRRWGYHDLFFALRDVAGLSSEGAKNLIDIAKKYKYA